MLRQCPWLSVALFALLGVPAAAQPFGQPLSAEQVACEERQLERLQHRMWVHLEGSTLLLWRASAGGGLYRGIVSTSELGFLTGGRVHQEEQLAFDLLLKAEEDLLDPRRPRKPQAALVRRDVASNLNPAVEVPFHVLDLNVDLAPEVVDPSAPRLPLRISNRLAVGAGADDRAGRGIAIDDLLSPCHAQVSDFDLRVFAILARTVRPSQCLLEPFSTCGAGLERYKSVFFRGAEPLTYRLNIYPNLFTGITDARVAFLFHLQLDAQGRLLGGDLQALPLCASTDQVGCTNAFNPNFALFVLPPVRPGTERQGEAEFRRAAHLNLEYDSSPHNILQDTVDWQDLLRDTAWNDGAAASAPAADVTPGH
jgi:hypothetical protein